MSSSDVVSIPFTSLQIFQQTPANLMTYEIDQNTLVDNYQFQKLLSLLHSTPQYTNQNQWCTAPNRFFIRSWIQNTNNDETNQQFFPFYKNTISYVCVSQCRNLANVTLILSYRNDQMNPVESSKPKPIVRTVLSKEVFDCISPWMVNLRPSHKDPPVVCLPTFQLNITQLNVPQSQQSQTVNLTEYFTFHFQSDTNLPIFKRCCDYLSTIIKLRTLKVHCPFDVKVILVDSMSDHSLFYYTDPTEPGIIYWYFADLNHSLKFLKMCNHLNQDFFQNLVLPHFIRVY